jgi:hypothetical protein
MSALLPIEEEKTSDLACRAACVAGCRGMPDVNRDNAPAARHVPRSWALIGDDALYRGGVLGQLDGFVTKVGAQEGEAGLAHRQAMDIRHRDPSGSPRSPVDAGRHPVDEPVKRQPLE